MDGWIKSMVKGHHDRTGNGWMGSRFSDFYVYMLTTTGTATKLADYAVSALHAPCSYTLL